jgi:hypothetical protein
MAVFRDLIEFKGAYLCAYGCRQAGSRDQSENLSWPSSLVCSTPRHVPVSLPWSQSVVLRYFLARVSALARKARAEFLRLGNRNR